VSCFLGIDIGTSGTKTILIDESGKLLAEASAKYPCSEPRPLWSEQNPDDWWKAVVKTVKAVVKESGRKKADVKAIGLSGQMHGSVFLDANDDVIRPALLWNDQRTAAECEEIERRAGGRSELIRMVANPALTGFTAPKILWLRNNEPQNFERLKKVLLPKDDVRRRLTGEYATEVSDASGMLLLDVAKRDWSNELLGKLDLDRSLLGKVYESEEVTGKLTEAAAKELGLSTDCLVVGGAGDCAANAIGTGVVKSGILSTSVGTSGVMFVHSDEMQFDPQGRLHTFCHAVRGKWHMMGVTLCAGRSLEWFAEKLCVELTAKGKDKGKSKDPYAVLLKEAAKAPAGSGGLLFLPYLSGERTPHADPDARGCFVGLTVSHERRHVVRSIVEGVCYSMRDSLEIIQNLGVPVNEIRVSGGASKAPFWRQVQADVFGQEACTINAEQGPAYGVALLAATGAGAFKDVVEACEATIDVVKRTPSDTAAVQAHNAAFPIYQQLYRSLKNDFKKIAALAAAPAGGMCETGAEEATPVNGATSEPSSNGHARAGSAKKKAKKNGQTATKKAVKTKTRSGKSEG
jgi:xylulokinase